MRNKCLLFKAFSLGYLCYSSRSGLRQASRIESLLFREVDSETGFGNMRNSKGKGGPTELRVGAEGKFAELMVRLQPLSLTQLSED